MLLSFEQLGRDVNDSWTVNGQELTELSNESGGQLGEMGVCGVMKSGKTVRKHNCRKKQVEQV